MRDTPDDEKTFSERVTNWLTTPEALARAKRAIRLANVPVTPADLLAEVQLRIWKRLQRSADELADANVAAYCTTVMKNTAAELLRGFAGSWKGLGSFADDQAEVNFAPTVLGGGFIDHLRSAIETAGQPKWVSAAALNYVNLSAYPDCDVSGAPASKAGATPDQARLWPSLWFAGRRDGLFPGPDGGGAAQRKRLSRAGATVQGLVVEASRLVGAGRP